METPGQFEYVAFISYDHDDKKIASKIQRNLESYVVPGSIRKTLPRLPKYVRPIFRDETDLGGGGIRAALTKELEKSRFLIVICSPRSAQSPWVGEEIRIFRNLGREKNIIPVIVDGIPHSEDEDTECFHKELSDCTDEPIGLDITKNGIQKVVIQILALILDVDFKILWDREGRRHKVNRIRAAVLTGVFILLSSLMMWYLMPKYEYYADYVDRWGIPVGLGKLDSETKRHKARSYEFKYCRIPIGEHNALSWRLSEISLINSEGIRIENPSRELIARYSNYKFIYSKDNGSLKQISASDALGKALVKNKISSYDNQKAIIYDIIGNSDEDASGYLNAYTIFSPQNRMMSPNQKSGIKRIVYKRDSNGFPIGVTFHSNNSDNLDESMVADANGAYGHSYKLDSLGRVIEIALISQDGEYINGINGVGKIVFTYEGNNLVTKTNLNKDNRPCIDESLVCMTEYQYDRYGNVIKEKYYDSAFKRTYTNELVAGKLATYDDNGNCILIRMLNGNDQPMVDCWGVGQVKFKYDSKGRQTEIIYSDLGDFLVNGKDGFAVMRLKYFDNTIFPRYSEYYGTNWSLKKNKEGVAAYERGIDSKGNLKWVCCYDENWHKSNNLYGVSKVVYDYDDNNRQIKESYFDVNNNPCNNSSGFHASTFQYDTRGNVQKISFFDIKGNTAMDNEGGISDVCFTYDKHGNLRERLFLLNSKKKKHNGWGFYKQRFNYNNFGIADRIEYYNTLDSLDQNAEGYSIATCNCDTLGNITKVRYFDKNGNPINNVRGIHSEHYRYNRFNQQTKFWTTDIEDRLIANIEGIAEYSSTYNKQGRQTSFTLYATNHKLAKGPDGFSKYVVDFNNHGLRTKISFYDENGLPSCRNKFGYATALYKYDSIGRLHICATYDEHNKLKVDSGTGYAKYVADFDADGNIVKRQSFNENNKLIVCRYGYATWIGNYDKEGNLESSKSLDEYGNIISKDKIKIDNQTRNETEYNKYYFKFDTDDIIIGIILIISSISFLIAFFCRLKKKIFDRSTLIYLCSSITLLGFGYAISHAIFLHYSVITPHIHNLSWVLLCVSIISLLFISIILIKDYLIKHFRVLTKQYRLNKFVHNNLYKRLYSKVWYISESADFSDTLLLLSLIILITGVYWYLCISVNDILNDPL